MKDLNFLMTGGNHWIGGVQYTRNLLRALDLLPASEKPRVVLTLGRKNLNCGYEEEFSRYKFVQVEEASTWVDAVNGAVRRVFGAKAVKALLPLTNAFRPVQKCTVAFPVKGQPLPMDIESVLWIPDFQYKCLPKYFQPEDRAQRDKLYAEMLEGDQILVLSSESVRADFLKYFPEYAHKRVRILHFSSLLSEEDYQPDPVEVCNGYKLPEKFAYLPNQFFQHKRHDLVFAALARLKAEGLEVNVVCTGNHRDYRSPEHYDSLLDFLNKQKLEGQVSLLGLIPRVEQLQIFRRAALVLQPSMFEGWSTTVEDGIALGKDVLLSDIPTHVEQAPEFATYFEAGNVACLAEEIRKLWLMSSPGPDPVREQHAREKNRRRGIAIANNFMDIMNEAHGQYVAKTAAAESKSALLPEPGGTRNNI
jgi:glycosyltransferase involved in cell wall biosynthesis